MAGSKTTYQYKESVSVPREELMTRVVLNEDMNKKDLRVFLHLLTHLDSKVPKAITKKHIAEDLNMSKKDVSEAIENLEIFGIIECRSSGSVRNGYVFLF